MKNTIKPLLFALLCGAVFASCKKDYTCECDIHVPAYTTSGVTIPAFDSTTNAEIKKATKKDAKSACDKTEAELITGYTALNGTASCELKDK